MSVWNLAEHGARTALVERGREISYADLASACDSIAEKVPARSLVFMLASNASGSVAGYLAFMNAGAVPLLLDEGINAELLAGLMDVYAPEYLWVPDSQVPLFSSCRKEFGLWDYSLLATGAKPPCELHPDLAVLVSTSGSTGTPKLVRLSARNIAANTASIVEYLGITADERAISSLPASYVYGMSVLHTHISVGATVVLTDATCYSGGFWKLFDECGCTSFAGVPFMYEMLAKLRFTKGERAQTLRTMTQAGGHLSRELQEQFASFAQRRDIDFVVMYGASEATARMSYLPPARALDKLGSIGVPVPGGRFQIVDEDGSEVPRGQAGELVYFGDNVSLGYSTCAADLAKPDENRGRLLTGDVARCDEDGFYFVVGRKKRFIKILGKRTGLDEVEELVKERFGIADVACGGVDDLLGVFVAADVDPAAISSFVHETIEVNEKMIAVRPIGEIPKNSAGKTLYAQLNELL